MTLSIGMVTVDSTDPLPLAQWWARRLGGRVVDQSDGWFVEVVPAEGATGPVLAFQRVEDPTPGKNRLHLDLRPTDQAAEVARREGLGATRAEVGQSEREDASWVVMADVEGNEFCVLRPLPSG